MMVKTPKDARSTGRKRGRKVLFDLWPDVPYQCRKCGMWPIRRPPDMPDHIDFKPGRLNSSLQVQHINKDILDNDEANLEWLCPSCHKVEDLTTSVGVSLKTNEFGYD